LKKKGQPLRSVGLHLFNWRKSLIGGLFFVVAIVVFTSIVPGLLMGWQLNISMLLWLIVYTLIMAVWEDIVFVGYIQTRIYGLVKKNFWAIALGGFVFAAMHYPSFFLNSFLGGEMGGVGRVIVLTPIFIMMHALLNHNFRYFRSIIPVTLFHFANNMAQREAIWTYTGDGRTNGFVGLSVTILAALLVPALFAWHEKRKTAR
jgi:hypothetical protein